MSIAAEIEQMEHLTLRGIMAIPKASDDYATQLSSFGRLAALYEQLKTRYPQVDTLSMGMSGDLNAAIASGSTMVRVGTGIFGKRQ